jgi:hypothetical protein
MSATVSAIGEKITFAHATPIPLRYPQTNPKTYPQKGAFNRLLKRTGHFWEKRYYCDGFAPSDRERALNTLRYIHGNPKAAKMRKGFFYDFSNYGSYERLTDDGRNSLSSSFPATGQHSLGVCPECPWVLPKVQT